MSNENAFSSDEAQLVTFVVGQESFGLDIMNVQEVIRMPAITRVPQSPKFVQGVVNLRGEVIPIIDMRRRFDMESKDYTDRTRIIVSEINSKKIGLIVDEVLEVLRISALKFEEVPNIVNDEQDQGYMDGIANMEDRMIMSLNLQNVLVNEEWKQLSKMWESTDKKAPANFKKQKN